MKQVTIYTDGGCEGNPGVGGWGALLLWKEHRRELSGGEPATTNNRMELQAAIAGLAALREPCGVTLFTDSQYLRRGVTEWLRLWKMRGWRRGKEPVKNVDLWQALDAQTQRHTIVWKWLKGHAGHEHNERCDALAAAAMQAVRKQHTPARLKELLKEFSRQNSERNTPGGPGRPLPQGLFR